MNQQITFAEILWSPYFQIGCLIMFCCGWIFREIIVPRFIKKDKPLEELPYLSEEPQQELLKKDNSDYSIIFFKSSNRFYPSYKGQFFFYWSAGYYTLQNGTSMAVFFDNKESALEEINKFKELYFSENKIEIKV